MRTGLLIAGLLLSIGACTPSSDTPSTSTPVLQSPPITSSAPSVASPADPSECRNPAGVPDPYFVVGNKGVTGPEIFVESTRRFSLSSNDTGEHHIDLFKLPDPADPVDTWTRDELLDLVRRESWPPEGVRVLEGGPKLSPMETWRVCTAPLAVGYYALVDQAIDPRSGEAYSQQRAYVWVVRVIPPM